jgi:hypothetical protein
MTPIETVDRALEVAKERLNAFPGIAMFSSIVAQIEYVAQVLKGHESDRSRMKDIIVGHYAARELEGSDPEFAELLFAVQAYASRMARGLKIV